MYVEDGVEWNSKQAERPIVTSQTSFSDHYLKYAFTKGTVLKQQGGFLGPFVVSSSGIKPELDKSKEFHKSK